MSTPNKKSKTRNSKLETNSNFKISRDRNKSLLRPKATRFEFRISVLRASFGFRASDFGWVLGLLLLLPGCAYSTRSRLPSHARSIAVPVFGNKTYFENYTRKLEVELTDAARRMFLQNGRLRIAGRENADLILEGDLLRLERRILRADRLGEAAETQIKLAARISLYDVKDARYVFRNLTVRNLDLKPESGVYNLRRGENERLGRERAIEDLARAIVQKVVDRW